MSALRAAVQAPAPPQFVMSREPRWHTGFRHQLGDSVSASFGDRTSMLVRKEYRARGAAARLPPSSLSLNYHWWISDPGLPNSLQCGDHVLSWIAQTHNPPQ